MSINFSVLNRHLPAPGTSGHAAASAKGGNGLPPGSVPHQFAAAAGLTSRNHRPAGGLPAAPRSNLLPRAAPRLSPSSPMQAPVSPPIAAARVPGVAQPQTAAWSTFSTTQVPVSQATGLAVAPSSTATAQPAPASRPRVPVTGQPAVFSWLPHAGRAPTGLAGAEVKRPRFQWAKAPPGTVT